VKFLTSTLLSQELAETAKVRDLLTWHEGRVPWAYHDSLGFLTIGIGHLIDRRKGGKLPDPIIDALFDYDLKQHSEELFRALPWARDLDPVRQAVLIDMAFNLGISGLLGFHNTLGAVRDKRWQDAARGMLASKWATQVGRRASRLSGMMLTGEWPKE
jgi:lysozyme